MRWPVTTLIGITCAILIGVAHSAALKINEYLGCDEELAPRNVDPFGGDW